MSITAANSTFTLTIPGVFQVPVRIEQFDTDDVYSIEQLRMVMTKMGVDGKLTGGFTFNEVKMSLHLMADSPSNAIFDGWATFMQTLVDAYPAFGTITQPSLGTSYVLSKGFMTGYPPLANAKKTLEGRVFELTWEKIVANPIQLVAPSPLPNPG